MLQAIADGWVQEQIHACRVPLAARRRGRRARVVVGVNQFGDDRPVPPPPFQHDPQVERRRAGSWRTWRAPATRPRARSACGALDAAARGSANLMPPILAALTAQRHARRSVRHDACGIRRLPTRGEGMSERSEITGLSHVAIAVRDADAAWCRRWSTALGRAAWR